MTRFSVKDGATGACALVMIGIAAVYSFRSRDVPSIVVGTDLTELDSMSRYLAPTLAAPEVESYDMFLPAQASLPIDEPVYAEPPPRRRLSAIMVIGSNPVAIIDDKTVRAGDVLSAGTKVVDITQSGVTLEERDGSRRTLQLSPYGAN